MSDKVIDESFKKQLDAFRKENRRLKDVIAAYQAAADSEETDHNPMQVLLDNIPAYIYFKDRQRRFVHASRFFCNLFECGIEDIIGKRDEDLFPEAVAKVTVADDNQVITTGSPILHKEEGSELIGDTGHWVLTTKLPWRDQHGSIIGLFGISMDITTRKQAELALLESEEKFKNLAEQSPNMIFINKGGRVVYANKRCEELLEYRVSEFYAEDFDFLALIAPEYEELIRKNFQLHQQGKEVSPYEYALISKSGRRFHTLITTKLIDYQGTKAILGIVTDISSQKLYEQKLEKQETELKNQALHLEEVNVALKILLEQREKEKTTMEKNILVSMEKLVLPYLDKLHDKVRDEEALVLLKIAKSNISDIISPYTNLIASRYRDLTPSELEIINLVKQGMASKDIAQALHISPKAVAFHRGNIRKKLGLVHQKINLYTYLQSLSP